MADVEIGIGKSGRRGYGFDDIAIVASRRTRDAGDVDLSWQLDAFGFALPMLAAPMDSVVSPRTAPIVNALGGLAVLNLEGLWTRYEDPSELFEQIAAIRDEPATPLLQRLYSAPVRPELVRARIAEVGATGAVTCGAITPQHAAELVPAALSAELDVLVIQGTVVSAEHVSKGEEHPLNLKRFIREIDIPVIVGGCASYQSALHLMRTGAVGILVGGGRGDATATRSVLGLGSPQATAIADAAGARSRHLEETGVYVQVVADGGIRRGGDVAKAIACGADAVMIGSPLAGAAEAPGLGVHWGSAAAHARLPRGNAVRAERLGTLEEILLGPSRDGDGQCNLFGALRSTMAMCGYASIREFHKADVVVSPGMGPGLEPALAGPGGR